MPLFKVAEEETLANENLGFVHCSLQKRRPSAHTCVVGRGLCVQNCICHWMALTSKPHPQVGLPTSPGQHQQGCWGDRSAPQEGGLHSGGVFCLGKEITEYLSKEHSFIPETLWGLFWEKLESLGKVS